MTEEESSTEAESEAESTDEEESSGSLLTREELVTAHEDMGKSFTEIAEELDVTPSTISYYAKKYGIESTSQHQSYEGTKVDDPEWLQEQYHDNELSMQEVGDLVGASDGTVMRYMQKHDIEPRRARSAGSTEPGPFEITESVRGVGAAKIGALEERGLEGDDDVAELEVVSDPEDDEAVAGLAETHGWSENLAESVLEQLEEGEPATQNEEDEASEE